MKRCGDTTAAHHRQDRESGQAMVEFVLVLLPLVVFVGGVIQLGIGIANWHDLNRIANEGARYAAINEWPDCPSGAQPCTGNPACTASQAALNGRSLANFLRCEAVDAGLEGIRPQDVVICRPNATAAIGDPVTVRLSNRVNFLSFDRWATATRSKALARGELARARRRCASSGRRARRRWRAHEPSAHRRRRGRSGRGRVRTRPLSPPSPRRRNRPVRDRGQLLAGPAAARRRGRAGRGRELRTGVVVHAHTRAVPREQHAFEREHAAGDGVLRVEDRRAQRDRSPTPAIRSPSICDRRSTSSRSSESEPSGSRREPPCASNNEQRMPGSSGSLMCP